MSINLICAFNSRRRSSTVPEASSAPSWSSIDALPRIDGTGLCVECDDLDESRPRTSSQGTSSGRPQESDSLSTQDSPVDRIDSPTENAGPDISVFCEHLDDKEHERGRPRSRTHALVHANGHADAHANEPSDSCFGYENNFHYLSPNHCYEPSSIERNVSQVSGSSCDSGYHGGVKLDKDKKAALGSMPHCKCEWFIDHSAVVIQCCCIARS